MKLPSRIPVSKATTIADHEQPVRTKANNRSRLGCIEDKDQQANATHSQEAMQYNSTAGANSCSLPSLRLVLQTSQAECQQATAQQDARHNQAPDSSLQTRLRSGITQRAAISKHRVRAGRIGINAGIPDGDRVGAQGIQQDHHQRPSDRPRATAATSSFLPTRRLARKSHKGSRVKPATSRA